MCLVCLLIVGFLFISRVVTFHRRTFCDNCPACNGVPIEFVDFAVRTNDSNRCACVICNCVCARGWTSGSEGTHRRRALTTVKNAHGK